MFSDAVPYIISGKTDAEGKAVMNTQDHPGVPQGEFKVTVVKEVPTPSQFGDAPPEVQGGPDVDMELAEAKAADEWRKKRENEYRPTHSYVAKKYALKETTDLTVSTVGVESVTLDVGPAVDDLSFPDDSSPTPK